MSTLMSPPQRRLLAAELSITAEFDVTQYRKVPLEIAFSGRPKMRIFVHWGIIIQRDKPTLKFAMQLMAIGLNHDTAPVDLRERVSFGPDIM